MMVYRMMLPQLSKDCASLPKSESGVYIAHLQLFWFVHMRVHVHIEITGVFH